MRTFASGASYYQSQAVHSTPPCCDWVRLGFFTMHKDIVQAGHALLKSIGYYLLGSQPPVKWGRVTLCCSLELAGPCCAVAICQCSASYLHGIIFGHDFHFLMLESLSPVIIQ